MDNIKFIDLCIYLPKYKTLIFGDVHLGYEESLRSKGILIPKKQLKNTIERLKQTIYKLEIKTIVINGDLKHEFGRISNMEWSDCFKLLDFLLTKCSKVVVIQGNHDRIIYPITNKKGIELKKYTVIGDILITHGDIVPKEIRDIKTIIIGHEHPAVTLTDYPRKEKYKCFLLGKYKRKNLIVMPSYNLFSEGADISENKFLSPFIQNNNFEVYVVGEDVKYFGRLRDLV